MAPNKLTFRKIQYYGSFIVKNLKTELAFEYIDVGIV
jgi:hypothetical protein